MGKNRVGRRLAKTVADLFCIGLFLLPVVYLLLSLILLFFIHQRDYPLLLRWYRNSFPEAFDGDAVAAACFTPAWYGWVRSWSLVLGLTLLIVLAVYLLFGRRVWRFCRTFLSEAGGVMRMMREVFRNCSGRERAVLFGLFGLILLYR